MEKELNNFLKIAAENFDAGFFKFNGTYYSFLKKGEEFEVNSIDENLFNSNFIILAEEKLGLWVKVIEGLVHNTNGKITPLFSRLGLIESKMESLCELPDFKGVDRVFQKIVKATKELINVLELTGNYVGNFSLQQSQQIDLKRFFEGFFHSVITDRFLKHKVLFDIDIEEETKISANVKDFFKSIYWLSESIFCIVREKKETINLKISVFQEMKTEIAFLSGEKPFLLKESDNLTWNLLQSLMYYRLFLDNAKRLGWNVVETSEGIKVEI